MTHQKHMIKLPMGARRTIKVAFIVLASLVGFVVLYFVAQLVCSLITVNTHPENPDDGVKIYILSNGAHADIVVPVSNDLKDWHGLVDIDDTVGKDHNAGFVAFGWGDKGFYMDIETWDELTFPIAFRAVFALSTTAMHVTFYRDITEGELCKSMRLTTEEYSRLVRYIEESFQKDSAGKVIYVETNAQYGANDAFYEAHGRYNLFFTCNTWTNRALKICGQRAALWTIFDTGILRHYD